ncbi:hypothetical protein B0F90DRAFT_1735976, partial [Multifurca ochricompacta]
MNRQDMSQFSVSSDTLHGQPSRQRVRSAVNVPLNPGVQNQPLHGVVDRIYYTGQSMAHSSSGYSHDRTTMTVPQTQRNPAPPPLTTNQTQSFQYAGGLPVQNLQTPLVSQGVALPNAFPTQVPRVTQPPNPPATHATLQTNISSLSNAFVPMSNTTSRQTGGGSIPPTHHKVSLQAVGPPADKNAAVPAQLTRTISHSLSQPHQAPLPSSLCKLPGCKYPVVFDNNTREQRDYCQTHLKYAFPTVMFHPIPPPP